MQRPRKVLILGGGFGGVTVAQQLEKTFGHDPSVEVTLVSRDNYLLFVPMLPEVASGSIELTHILSPLRRLCPRTSIRTEVIQAIDLANRQVTTVHTSTRHESMLEYDQLVIALGNVTDLSKLPGLAQHGERKAAFLPPRPAATLKLRGTCGFSCEIAPESSRGWPKSSED